MRVWGSCGLSLIGDIFLRLDLSNQASCFPTLSPWLVCAQKGLLNILQPRLPPHHQHSRSSPSCPIFPNQSDACCASQTSCSSFLHHSLEPPCTVAAPTKQSHWIQAISGGGVLTKALFASCLCPFVGEIGSGPKEYNRFSKTPAFPAALGVAVRTAEPAGSVEWSGPVVPDLQTYEMKLQYQD